MRYKINDKVKKNEKILTIIDCENIDRYNIYYFSDGSSQEESKFKILTKEELDKLSLKEFITIIEKNSKSVTERIHSDAYKWVVEQRRLKKESSSFYKFQKFIRNTLGF